MLREHIDNLLEKDGTAPNTMELSEEDIKLYRITL